MRSLKVRDVAWAPNLGLPMNTIASAGQDGKVGAGADGNSQVQAPIHLVHCYSVLIRECSCV